VEIESATRIYIDNYYNHKINAIDIYKSFNFFYNKNNKKIILKT